MCEHSKIKKYDDNYIDLSKVDMVSKIHKGDVGVQFIVLFHSGVTIEFEHTIDNKQRLSTLRERLVKDWMEVVSAKD